MTVWSTIIPDSDYNNHNNIIGYDKGNNSNYESSNNVRTIPKSDDDNDSVIEKIYKINEDKNDKVINNKVVNNNTAKYGDDLKHEPTIDNYLFFPMADLLIDPLRNIGLTPNMVTLISTFFTLFTIYYLEKNNLILAACSYLFGYVLDCVDGKMARKYNMGSDLGMVLDTSSDVLSNCILSFYILCKFTLKKSNIVLAILTAIISALLILSYSLNEAIQSYNQTGDDNFYMRRFNQLEKQRKSSLRFIYNFYLFITKMLYKLYRFFFPTFNNDTIYKWLPILKEMGPGTVNAIMAVLILNL